MPWVKKGFIFKPDQSVAWMQSHAQVPTVLVTDDKFRVYFSTRDQQGKSQLALIDLALDNPQHILKLHHEPLVTLGNPGTFDDDGVMPSYICEENNRLWLYYSGWNQRTNTPYHNAMGIFFSDDGGDHFYRVDEGPIMDRTRCEPYLAVTPTIINESHHWKMWYISGLRWEKIQGKYEPIYAIKYAHSNNGLDWQRDSELCVAQQYPLEAFSRPCVIKENGIYRMWYCFRDSRDFRNGVGSYRIGYAESSDGKHFDRQDENAGITVSEEGWDSLMLCYPYVVRANNQWYLFYNGNGFGESGFGYAVWN